MRPLKDQTFRKTFNKANKNTQMNVTNYNQKFYNSVETYNEFNKSVNSQDNNRNVRNSIGFNSGTSAQLKTRPLRQISSNDPMSKLKISK